MSLQNNQDFQAIGLTGTEKISEAGRKILRFHFLRMVYHEPGTRRGDDLEYLHDMRVATRRMRSALGTFRPFYKKKIRKRYMKDLREVGFALGTVRDIDVFLENMGIEVELDPQVRLLDLSALRNFWQLKREAARAVMLRHLDSSPYQEFLFDFDSFLNTPNLGLKKRFLERDFSHSIQESLPKLIKDHFWRVQVFSEIVNNASVEELHKLRIEIKKLRYLLEFFKEILGEQSVRLIDQLKRIQDHLGKLNDAVVAKEMIKEFIETSRKNVFVQAQEQSVIYLQIKQTERENLQTTFPYVWNEPMKADFKEGFYELVESIENQ